MYNKKIAASFTRKAGYYEQKWQKYLLNTHNNLLYEFSTKPGDGILDVSAGTGLLAKFLLERGYKFSELVLNDISEGMLEAARNRFGQNNKLSYSNNNAEALKFKSNTFDIVICSNAFHYYENQQKALQEIHRVLKPGGDFWLLDWNRKGFFKTINFFIKHFTVDLIQTQSASEARRLLEDNFFSMVFSKEWRFQYWKLFLIRAKKIKNPG